MTCPTCGRETPSSKNTDATLVVPQHMMVAMVHALAIGRNSEMMCSNPEAAAAFETMRAHIAQHALGPFDRFSDRAWTKISMRAFEGADITVTTAHVRWGEYDVQVHLDGRVYTQDERCSEAEAEKLADELRAHLDLLKPLI
jgi:hypothetical protein